MEDIFGKGALLFFTAVTIGCSDPVVPEESRLSCSEAPSYSRPGPSASVDEWNSYYASIVPGGVGGFYLTRNESVVEFKLVDLTKATPATERLRAELMNSPFSQLAAKPLQPVSARYDFLELSGCKSAIAANLSAVVQISRASIDEQNNRVAISVNTENDRAVAQSRLAQSGYPETLFAISIDSPVPVGQ